MKVKLQWRLVFSGLFAAVLFLAYGLWNVFRSSIEASAAVAQIQDSITTYSLTQQLLTSNVGARVLMLVFLIAMLAVWVPYLKARREPPQNTQ
jgi:hypothetical protein